MIKKLTITQYHEFTKNLNCALAINGDLARTLANISGALSQIKAGDSEKAIQLYQNALISANLSANKALSFYIEAYVSLFNKELSEVLKMEHSDIVADVTAKEKLIRLELDRADFSKVSISSLIDKKVTRVLNLYNWVMKSDAKSLEKVEEINKFFLEKEKPTNFNPSSASNFLKLQDANFERNCISITEITGVQDVKNKTVYEFFSLINYCKEKEKQYKKRQ